MISLPETIFVLTEDGAWAAVAAFLRRAHDTRIRGFREYGNCGEMRLKTDLGEDPSFRRMPAMGFPPGTRKYGEIILKCKKNENSCKMKDVSMSRFAFSGIRQTSSSGRIVRREASAMPMTSSYP